MARAGTPNKIRRWNFRVSGAEDDLVRRAAGLSDSSHAGFVRAAALADARRILADRAEFELDQRNWDAFTALLNRPARVPPGLEDLFSEPTVFD